MTKVTGRVRADGERIVMDIALLAKGSVLGTVSRYASAGSLEKVPVPGALVRVFSVTESQSFGQAVTDGDGRYRVDGITVGPVAVHAASGQGVGSGAGRIDRPGTPAVVDITLDDNAVRVSGTVYKADPNEPDPKKRTTVVPGIQVLYHLGGQLVGATETDAAGHYVFESLPAGVFTVSAALNTRDRAKSLPISGSRGDDADRRPDDRGPAGVEPGARHRAGPGLLRERHHPRPRRAGERRPVGRPHRGRGDARAGRRSAGSRSAASPPTARTRSWPGTPTASGPRCGASPSPPE